MDIVLFNIYELWFYFVVANELLIWWPWLLTFNSCDLHVINYSTSCERRWNNDDLNLSMIYVVEHRVIDEWAESQCLLLTSRAQRTSQTWRPHVSTTRCFAEVRYHTNSVIVFYGSMFTVPCRSCRSESVFKHCPVLCL